MPGGSLEGVTEPVHDGNRNAAGNPSPYMGRLLFDLSFFVIVGIILFNVITGLMVDTFSSLREEAAERANTLDNECFACGLSRAA